MKKKKTPEHPTKIRQQKEEAARAMFCRLADAHPVLKQWAHAVQDVLGRCADSVFGHNPRLDLTKAKHKKNATIVPIMGIQRGFLTRSRLRKTGRVYIRNKDGQTTISIRSRRREVACAYLEKPQRYDMSHALKDELRNKDLLRKPGLD